MIVDTGPLVAAAITNDPDHRRCRDLLETAPGPLVVPTLVVAEVAYLIDRELGAGADAAFYRSLARGELTVEPVGGPDWERMAQLVEQYRDLRLGGVDASVIAAAERLGEKTVATLDRRHFSVVRPRHVRALTLLP